MRKNLRTKIATAIGSAVVLFLLCASASALAVARLQNIGTVAIWPNHFFLLLVKNQSFVFSLPLPNWAAIGVAAAALALVNWIYFFTPGIRLTAGYAFLMGGALTNLYSRLANGFVWDFFNITFFGIRGVWNLADGFIIAGICLWVYAFSRVSRPVSDKIN